MGGRGIAAPVWVICPVAQEKQTLPCDSVSWSIDLGGVEVAVIVGVETAVPLPLAGEGREAATQPPLL